MGQPARAGAAMSVVDIASLAPMSTTVIAVYNHLMAKMETGCPQPPRAGGARALQRAGIPQVTVEEIAQRAGLTERTFFRHFADKREVLFSGAGVLQEHLVHALEDAPRSLSAIDAAGVAVDLATALFQERRPFSPTPGDH